MQLRSHTRAKSSPTKATSAMVHKYTDVDLDGTDMPKNVYRTPEGIIDMSHAQNQLAEVPTNCSKVQINTCRTLLIMFDHVKATKSHMNHCLYIIAAIYSYLTRIYTFYGTGPESLLSNQLFLNTTMLKVADLKKQVHTMKISAEDQAIYDCVLEPIFKEFTDIFTNDEEYDPDYDPNDDDSEDDDDTHYDYTDSDTDSDYDDDDEDDSEFEDEDDYDF